jgi:hypothetical protein
MTISVPIGNVSRALSSFAAPWASRSFAHFSRRILRMPRSTPRATAGSAIAALTLLLITGCGGPSVGDVSGTVKFKGEPIPNGRITFYSQVGRKEAQGGRIQDGEYTVTGVAVGPTQVTVETFGSAAADTGGKTPKGVDVSGFKGMVTNSGGKKIDIPARYAQPNTSKLEFEVKSGSQTHNVDLTP